MRSTTLIIAVVAVVAAGAAHAETAVGTYACVTHRTVGLQGGDDRPREAGRIKLPAEQQHFTVKLAPIEQGDGCKPLLDGAFDEWYTCKSSFELTFSKGKKMDTLRGDELHVFLGVYGNRFHIGNDLGFVLTYTDLDGNYFLEEGECTPM